MMVSAVHCVSKKDTYIAIISTVVETNEPEKEIEVAFGLIGNVREKFVRITERYEPVKNYDDGVFISNSFDATSHFENETENVLNLYKQITGKDLDLTNLPEDADE
jgi:Rab GDP dissociation inhibitor